MFTTTMTALALTLGAFIPGPTWTGDYSAALRQASEQSKPIAVFIADGSEGFAHVLNGGSLPTEATKVLNDKYVSLFVDTSTEEGKATAKAFELKEGLVISDHGGIKQAFRHNGAVKVEDLNKLLTQYAEKAPVQTIVSPVVGSTVRSTSMYSPASPAPAPVYAPAAAPAFTPAPAYSPYGSPVVNPYYCPNCQRR